MILVTGMHRSGTSCVAGLLARCGLTLGTGEEGAAVRNEHNPKGYFENTQMLAINELILKHAGGSWRSPPPAEAIMEAGRRFATVFTEFYQRFDGDMAKDPRSCVTVDLWEALCPSITANVFCLRNPLAVADSLRRRDGIPVEAGINLWHVYVSRFFARPRRKRVIVVDYDTVGVDLPGTVHGLLTTLGRPAEMREIRRRTEGFYEAALDHTPLVSGSLTALPADVLRLYREVKERSLTPRHDP